MAISKFFEDLDIIQKLDTYPNDTDGLTAEELKERFDRAGNLLKAFLNNSLIEELLAKNLPFSQSTSVPADNIQDAIENVQKQISDVALNAIPNRTVTREKLSKSLDDLLNLLVSDSSSHDSSITELDASKAVKSVSYAKTLIASEWTVVSSPYQYDLYVDGVSADKNIAVFFGESISDNERNQSVQNNVRVYAVENNKVVFQADAVPRLDIPVSILILG